MELNLIILTETLNSYMRQDFHKFLNFVDIRENKIKFPTTSMSCRNFHKQSCQLHDNKNVKILSTTSS